MVFEDLGMYSGCVKPIIKPVSATRPPKGGCSIQCASEVRSPTRRATRCQAEKDFTLLRADRSPGKFSRVCSCHFKVPSSKSLPVLFEWNRTKRQLFTSPIKTNPRIKRQAKTSGQCIEEQDKGNSAASNACIHPSNESGFSEDTLSEVSQQTSNLNDVICNISYNASMVEEQEQQPSLDPAEEKIITLEVLLQNKCDENIALEVLLQSQSDKNIVLEEELQNEYESRENLNAELVSQKRQNLILQAEVDVLQRELSITKALRKGFTLSEICSKPKLMSHFTGLPNIEVFNLILSFFDNVQLSYYSGWEVETLSKADQLLLTLFKLRRNPSMLDLANRFKVSEGIVQNTFLTWLSALHQVLVECLMEKIPSRFKNMLSLPTAFEEFPSCRIVLDCTEIYAATPKKMSDQNARYSNYKHRITLKGLVGVAPNGTITFLSNLYPGSTSDKSIVQNCGILDKLEAGDCVLADKGFLIADILPPGVTLNIPPFKTTPQMTVEQVDSTLKIAKARVHVERAIRAMKTFQILDFVHGKCAPFASKVFQVCGSLANFKFPLIREVIDSMKTTINSSPQTS